jgi:hypothetical protein
LQELREHFEFQYVKRLAQARSDGLKKPLPPVLQQAVAEFMYGRPLNPKPYKTLKTLKP